MDSEPIQEAFQAYTGRPWKAWEYRRWVEEGLTGEIEDPFEAVKWQQVLGGEGFLCKVKDQWNQGVERPKNYGQKKNWSAVGAEQILERVPSSNSVAQTIQRTKTQHAQTLKVLKQQISHK